MAVPADAEVVLDEADLAKPDAPPFRFVPGPHLAWQREAAKDATLDGVLFLDAYYQPSGTLQVLGVTDTKEQEPRAAALVKTDGPAAITLVATGGAWRERLQKKLSEAAGPNRSLFRRTRLNRLGVGAARGRAGGAGWLGQPGAGRRWSRGGRVLRAAQHVANRSARGADRDADGAAERAAGRRPGHPAAPRGGDAAANPAGGRRDRPDVRRQPGAGSCVIAPSPRPGWSACCSPITPSMNAACCS
ncbi:MAG: hypothetical protein U0736_22755 [Gemmataceae bacterium]